MPLLTVILPVRNQEKAITHILEKINAVAIDKEIIVVDDCSIDGTGKILREMQSVNLKVIHHGSHRGKGEAILTGLSHASGEYVIIQDADFDYDPSVYLKLVDTIEKGEAQVVLGVRPKAGKSLLTALFSILFGVKLNNWFSGCKVMRRLSLVDLSLRAKSFDIGIEILVKAAKKGMRIVEVPI